MIDRIIDLFFASLFSNLFSWIGKKLSQFFNSPFFDKIKLELFVFFLGILAFGCILATLLFPKSLTLHVTFSVFFCILSVCQYRIQKPFSKWALEKLLIELFLGGIVFSVVLARS